jgi:predicted nucleic acid-binding protein
VKPALVLDASVTMAWCFPGEATRNTSELLDRMKSEAAAVPPVWYLEITNALAIAERKGRIPPAEVARFISLLERCDLETDDQAASQAFAHLLPLCRSHRLTSYDAAYLELALRRQLPLASLDDDLRAAAKMMGLRLLGK